MMDSSSLFSSPTAQPQQSGLGGLLSLFGGGGGTAGQNPQQQQMAQGLLAAGAPHQLPMSTVPRPMMGGMGGGGMRAMGIPQGGLQGGAALGSAAGNPFLARLLQRLQQTQQQQPAMSAPGAPSTGTMSPQDLNFLMMMNGY